MCTFIWESRPKSTVSHSLFSLSRHINLFIIDLVRARVLRMNGDFVAVPTNIKGWRRCASPRTRCAPLRVSAYLSDKLPNTPCQVSVARCGRQDRSWGVTLNLADVPEALQFLHNQK